MKNHIAACKTSEKTQHPQNTARKTVINQPISRYIVILNGNGKKFPKYYLQPT
jgi:hypothetical protein